MLNNFENTRESRSLRGDILRPCDVSRGLSHSRSHVFLLPDLSSLLLFHGINLISASASANTSELFSNDTYFHRAVEHIVCAGDANGEREALARARRHKCSYVVYLRAQFGMMDCKRGLQKDVGCAQH